MAKRFTDTNKYKKPFIRSLPGAYKILWDFLYHDCDHSGIWIVDFEIAQTYVGSDMEITEKGALFLFNDNEMRIVVLDGGKKWFIPSFIEFQYVKLSEKNRAHLSVINTLNRFGLLNPDLTVKTTIEKNKPLTSPLQGAIDKDMDKEKELDKDEGGSGGRNGEGLIVPEMLQIFKETNPEYLFDQRLDLEAAYDLAVKVHKFEKLPGQPTDYSNLESIKTRWGECVLHIKADSHYSTYSLTQINKYFQGILQSLTNKKNGTNKQNIVGGDGKGGGNGKLGTSAARIDAAKKW